MQIIHSTEQATYPLDMPPKLVLEAKKSFICERLYRWFNFYSPQQLKEKNVDYIIISSFSYNHFLLDSDPNKKTGLFNPYLREDTLSNNRQSERYLHGGRHNL
jgi:hypothetical protein